jgi:hypothetical protein
MTTKDELVKIWKEAVVILLGHYPNSYTRGMKENYEYSYLDQYNQFRIENRICEI